MAPTYFLARLLFLRGLGVVGCAAFLSLSGQILGLIGSRGILPLSEYLELARQSLGQGALWQLPTLFWLSASDGAILGVTIAGLVVAVLLTAGLLEGPAIAAVWVCYLSLTIAGQTFLGFQWDSLFLESLLMGAFWASWSWRPGADRDHAAGRWLVWLLVAKLMFLSGATKLLSGDVTWRDLSALTFHYLTQPLPSWISWWTYRLPGALHRASVVAMLAMEITLPLLLLLPWKARLARRLAAAGFIALQLVIAWTGNYGFFNVLSIVLACSLVDDDLWRRWLPLRRSELDNAPRSAFRGRWIRAPLAGVLAVLSILALAAELQRTAGREPPPWQSAALQAIAPVRSINGYGLFRVMTTERPEIAVEVSDDGLEWRELAFRYKPGDPARRPRIVPFHMPRLDWQMWFAALSPRRAQGWLVPFLERLLQGEPSVWSLLAEPRPASPPRMVRMRIAQYRFTTGDERAGGRGWWVREPGAPLGPELVLGSDGRIAPASR